MLFGATTASAEDAVDHGLPPSRRMSSSADGPLRNGGRRRERGGSMASAAGSIPEPVVLVLGNFQGVVVLDMGLVMVSVVAAVGEESGTAFF